MGVPKLRVSIDREIYHHHSMIKKMRLKSIKIVKKRGGRIACIGTVEQCSLRDGC